jgi:PleD family two-component response regulator
MHHPEWLRDNDSDEPMHAPLVVTVSMGVTGLQPEDTMESLVKRADVALCEARAAGGNQVKMSV